MSGICTGWGYALKLGQALRERGVWGSSRCLGPYNVSLWFLPAGGRTPLPVEKLLVPAPLLRAIVLPAPLVRLLAAVVLAAAERTVQIPPIRVPRMREKANLAMTAWNRIVCQAWTIAQDRIKRSLILTNKRTSTVVLMPIRAK